MYKQLADWLVPALIAAAIVQLQRIAGEMKEITRQLAIAITKVDGHEQRIQRLEARIDDANP